ncbi:hypothetical protein BTVI_42321 [Pitangus sulphuratus]|nr:hypothetical protein BTVI_42321 [Pitangus sulphuratus]
MEPEGLLLRLLGISNIGANGPALVTGPSVVRNISNSILVLYEEWIGQIDNLNFLPVPVCLLSEYLTSQCREGCPCSPFQIKCHIDSSPVLEACGDLQHVSPAQCLHQAGRKPKTKTPLAKMHPLQKPQGKWLRPSRNCTSSYGTESVNTLSSPSLAPEQRGSSSWSIFLASLGLVATVQSMLSRVIQVDPLTGKASNVSMGSSDTQCEGFDISVEPSGAVDQDQV